jgi:glycosyltransferase involved in cell wall biosynthesis
MARNLKVLIPALVLDPLIYAVEKPKSQVEQYSAVYFGRLSREKGLVDLLRACSIIFSERT